MAELERVAMTGEVVEETPSWEEVKYCGCGCGEPTPLATTTIPKLGHVKGKPTRYIAGHNSRTNAPFALNDYEVRSTGHDTPCWLWNRPLHGRGYATLLYKGHHYLMHHIHYEREYGDIPEGYELDHLCRVRHCVNPEHLEPVTRAENARRGKKAILTIDRVRQIRADFAEGVSRRVLAASHGVSEACITDVILRRTWRE